MIWQTLSANETIFRLKTCPYNGLGMKEAEKRLAENGKNELCAKRKESLFKKFISQFCDSMIIILLAAALISFFVSLCEGNGDFTEPVVIASIVIINALVGTVQENKAEKSLEALKNITKMRTHVIRDGKITETDSDNVVCGDILKLKAGDFVPADARIVSSSSLKVDESALTGESEPVLKNHSRVCAQSTPVADMSNMLWSSTAITNGHCTAVVVETGMNTQVGKIANAIAQSESPQTPLQEKLAGIGKMLGLCALLICGAVFVIGISKNIPATEIFMTSVSLAVAAIPEGLPAVVTVMLALGVQKMVSKNAIVKKLPAVETLGSASVICSDKTGTLTQNKMSVTEIFGDTQNVIETALMCSNGTDSTERAIYDFSQKSAVFTKSRSRIKEIPFSSETKFAATLNKEKGGYILAVKGALDVVLPKCSLSEPQKGEILKAHKKMTDQALRVIAVARKESAFSIPCESENMEFCGLVGISDPPRKEVYRAVKSCKKAGIKAVMITGDHADTASAIARQIGIPSAAITGTELDKMSDFELKNAVKHYSVFARVTPEHKVRIVNAFQSNGEVVAMTGDGVNDAPALRRADIGCAMGITGTDVAKNAADVILTDDNFATIVDAVYEGRCIFANIKKSVHFLFSCNIGEILTIFCAIAANLPSPLTAVQLLWVNLITDSLPAIALGVDSNSKSEIASQKPQKRSCKLFEKGRPMTIFLEGMMIGSLALTAFCMGYFKYRSCEAGRTMAFCVLSLSQLVHAFNVRSEKTVFSSALPINPLLLLSFAVGTLLQIAVVISPALSSWFSTTSLNVAQWKTVALLSIAPLAVSEISKLASRAGKVKIPHEQTVR